MAKTRTKSVRKSAPSHAQGNKPTASKPKHEHMLSFSKTNYLMMVAGVLVIAIGFILMTGGKQQGAEFNESEIYSFTRITLAPIVVILGFVIEVFAIFWNYKSPTKPTA